MSTACWQRLPESQSADEGQTCFLWDLLMWLAPRAAEESPAVKAELDASAHVFAFCGAVQAADEHVESRCLAELASQTHE